MKKYWSKVQNYYIENYQIVLASAVFLLVQFLYSWLMWHRGGNLPPTPGDSYNYLFNLNQMGVDHHFFTEPRQLVYGGFNYIYSLAIILTGLRPIIVYYFFFYLAKIILLGPVIYFLGSFTRNKSLLALMVTALAFYSGTGDAHGFFWVVPSFWSVLLFLLLVGMAIRQEKLLPILVVAILFMFTHPLSIYATVPIALACFILRLAHSEKSRHFGRLALIMLMALIIQQAYIYLLNAKYISPSHDVSQENQALSVIGSGVGQGINPQGGSVTDQADQFGNIRVGLLTVNDVVDKLRSQSPSSSYRYYLTVPKTIYRLAPGVYELWNAYGFYFASLPVPIIVFLTLMVMMMFWGYKKKDPLVALFTATLLTAIGATIHPQGFRFIVFLWPLTIMSLTYYFWLSTSGRIAWRTLALTLVVVFSLGELTYGVFMTHRIGIYQDYNWNPACAKTLISQVNTSPKNTVLFFSGATLAPTAFVGEGLYNIPAVPQADWQDFLSQPESENKFIIYLNDQADGYAPAGTVAKLDQDMAYVVAGRGKQIQWTNCGFFKYGEEK